MSLYLDASVLVALFVIDPSSARAEAFMSANPVVFVISDFGAAVARTKTQPDRAQPKSNWTALEWA